MTATLVERGGARVATSVLDRAPRRRIAPERIAAALTVLVLAGLAIAAIVDLELSLGSMLASLENASRFLARVGAIELPPLPELVALTGQTLGLVLTGTVLSAVLSVPVAYLAAANTTPSAAIRGAARGIGVLARAMPDVVLAMAFVLILSLGSLPGILAIALHSVGMISKLFADAIEQIDEGPVRAIRAAGGGRMQQLAAGILPQVLPSWVATVLHRNDINLRGSVILGYVGVAGLGLEMAHAFKSLEYGLGLGIALVVLVLCVAMELVSSVVRTAMLGVDAHAGVVDRLVRRLLPRRARGPRATRIVGTTPAEALHRPWTAPRVRRITGAWLAVAVVVVGVVLADIRWSSAFTSWDRVPEVLARFWPPTFGSYGASRMLDALGETIAIALAATLITLVLSMVVGSLAATNVAPSGAVRQSMRLLLVAIRGVPEVILAIVLVVITGLGAQAGTLALAIGGIGLLGKLLADSLEEVHRGPERALRAAGAGRLQTFASATLPQGVPAVVGHTFYALDTNIRAATLLGIVGGGGIGYYLLNASQGSNYGMVTAVVLMILAVVLVVEGLAMWLRRVFR